MLPILVLLAGLVVLAVGAEMLVRGASRASRALGVTPLMVGLTVVAFGTSAPELAVTAGAAYTGAGDIALGNIVGSNILNILVILGFSALIVPLAVSSELVRLHAPVMLGAGIVVAAFALDGVLTRADGAILVILAAIYLWLTVRLARRDTKREEELRGERRGDARYLTRQIVLAVAGLALLLLGAQWTLSGAVDLARAYGVSELVIGLTIIALGTSLPELATSAFAALRGERDLAVGNAIGSCIFNLLPVLGVAALIAPDGIAVARGALVFDIPVMLATFLVCFPVFLTRGTIDRWEGAIFLGYYAAYVGYLLLRAADHPFQDTFGDAMIYFVLPLTLLAIVVALVPLARARFGRRGPQA